MKLLQHNKEKDFIPINFHGITIRAPKWAKAIAANGNGDIFAFTEEPFTYYDDEDEEWLNKPFERSLKIGKVDLQGMPHYEAFLRLKE